MKEDNNEDKLLLLVMQSPSATQMVDDMIDETLAAVKRSNQLSPEADRCCNAAMLCVYADWCCNAAMLCVYADWCCNAMCVCML